MSNEWSDKALKNSIKNYLQLLERGDRKRFVLNLGMNVALALIDLLGVVFIGILGSVLTLGIQEKEAGGLTRQFLEFTGLSGLDKRSLLIFLVSGSVFAFFGKSIFSIIVLRKVTVYFETRAAELSSQILRDYLYTPGFQKKKLTSGNILFSFSRGIQTLYNTIIAGVVLLLGDVILTFVLLSGLIIADPNMALLTVLYFSALGIVLYKVTGSKLSKLGLENSELFIVENQLVKEISSTYKKIHAENLQEYYSNRYRSVKNRLTRINAQFRYNSLLIKIVFEISMILGVAVIVLVQFLSNTISTAVALTSVFIAASLRIGPAVLRIQQQVTLIRVAHQSAYPVWQLIRNVREIDTKMQQNQSVLSIQSCENEFVPRIKFTNVSFAYNDSKNVVSNLNLVIEPGDHTVLMGPSGTGKTTILDLLIGFLEPNSGNLTISGLPPSEAMKTWHGCTAYVSQDTYLEKFSISELFALPKGQQDGQESIHEVLVKVGLADMFFIDGKFQDRNLGENGSLLSGGQRQRLILARALYNKPKLLLLDEATSALDYESQFGINRVIRGLDKDVTVVSVTHRLENISYYDKLIELGREGNFKVIKKDEIPEFVKQKYIFD